MRRPYKRRPTVGMTLVPFGDNMVVQGNEQGICPDRIDRQFVESSRRRPPEVRNPLPIHLNPPPRRASSAPTPRSRYRIVGCVLAPVASGTIPRMPLNYLY